MNGGGALMVYRLYFSVPITLSFTSTTISAAAPYTGVLRVALVENRMLPLMNYGANAAVVQQWYDDNKGDTRDSHHGPRAPKTVGCAFSPSVHSFLEAKA